MDELREQCPWDRKQTIHSLRNLTIEEVYELSDAILRTDMADLKEELGDLFLHLVFYARIAREQSAFDVDDVLNAVCDKLVARHPHIYGDVEVADEEEVAANWEKLKLKEGKRSVLSGVPDGLPALNKAVRLQEKTAKVGFEWTEIRPVRAKVSEEMDELDEAVEAGDRDAIEAEFGDLLFALVNYARFLKLDPEAALERTNRSFKRRFEHIEERAADSGRDVHDLDLDEMDAYWEDAKRTESSGR